MNVQILYFCKRLCVQMLVFWKCVNVEIYFFCKHGNVQILVVASVWMCKYTKWNLSGTAWSYSCNALLWLPLESAAHLNHCHNAHREISIRDLQKTFKFKVKHRSSSFSFCLYLHLVKQTQTNTIGSKIELAAKPSHMYITYYKHRHAHQN